MGVLFFVLYLLPRYMRPEGPWQRLAAALADSSDHFSAFKPHPVPNYKESYRGSLISFSSCPPNKGKRTTHKTKEKNILFVASGLHPDAIPNSA